MSVDPSSPLAAISSVLDTLAPDAVVERRIRRDWRNDIKVLEHGTVNAPRGDLDAGTSYVVIGCRSRVACEQAFISLASFVANDERDWDDGWERGVEPYPFRLRLYAPRLEAYGDEG